MAFGAIVLLIVAYSFIYRSGGHPIPALYTEVTGQVPPSKGLSASFSEIVRGNFSLAQQFNPYGIRVFLFFGVQLLLRLAFSVAIKARAQSIRTIAILDGAISLTLFVYCFFPLISYTLKQIYSLMHYIP